jgi:hypothetical protein
LKKLLLLATLLPMMLAPTSAQAARLERWLPVKFSEGLVADPDLPSHLVGFINREGKTIIEHRFTAARPFCEGLAAVREDGKWGYVDHSGRFAIEPKFDAVGVLDYPGDDPMDFAEGCAAVRSGGRVGFIDLTGKFVIKPQFTSAWNFNGDVAAAQDWFSGKWGFIDRDGKWVIKPRFDDARSFSEGLAAVSNAEHGAEAGWGYVNKKGELAIQPVYTLALNFHEGLALVLKMKNGAYEGEYINKNGQTSGKLNCHGGNSFSQGLAPIPLKTFKVGYIDKAGKTIIAPQFAEAGTFNEGLAVVRFGDNMTWGLIDQTGTVVLKRSAK